MNPLRDWRGKLAVQWCFSIAPGGGRANALFQRYVTRSIPPSDQRINEQVHAAQTHLNVFRGAQGRDPTKPDSFFEFGAGWNLGVPISLALMGVRSQITVDLTRHATDDVVSDTIRRVREVVNVRGEDADLPSLGIDYQAPRDARWTGLPDQSVALIHSTSVLEHVPPTELAEILREMKRILRPTGQCSFLVDYKDHWAAFDHSLPAMHFLRYDEREWRRKNPPLQFQNRVRHHELVNLAEAEGFVVDERRVVAGTPQSVDWIKTHAQPRWRDDSIRAAVADAHLVLRHK